MGEMSDVESGREGEMIAEVAPSEILISRRSCCPQPVLRYSNKTG